MKKDNFFENVKENVKIILLSFIFALTARMAIAENRYIPSESMLPTLKIEDKIVVEKITELTKGFNRGDIVVFFPPFLEKNRDDLFSVITRKLSLPNHDAWIKRVIALPNEKVMIQNGTVYINGKPLEEKYIKEKPYYEMSEITVPNDSVFVLGDNRNNSKDGHVWGTLPQKYIVGKAAFRYWPLDRMGKILE
ncbi:MAG: signal peptidase I [Candidatus Sericytochromatia bacterium]